MLEKSSFKTSFDKPTGLHPTLRLQIDVKQPPSNPTCALHAYLTLPSPIFLDRYAFSDPLALSSHNIAALRSISGATDLEAPDWAVSTWGSAALFELKPPAEATSSTSSLKFDVTIPVHLRYLSPNPGGYSNVSMPAPVIIYACRAQDDEAPPLSTNPFDRRNLGYDGLFSDQTIFYHVPPAAGANGGLFTTIRVPVLDLDKAWYVQSGTVGVVLLGTLWLLWKLFGPLPRKTELGVKNKKSQ